MCIFSRHFFDLPRPAGLKSLHRFECNNMPCRRGSLCVTRVRFVLFILSTSSSSLLSLALTLPTGPAPALRILQNTPGIRIPAASVPIFRSLRAQTDAPKDSEARPDKGGAVYVSKGEVPGWRRNEALKIVKFAVPVRKHDIYVTHIRITLGMYLL